MKLNPVLILIALLGTGIFITGCTTEDKNGEQPGLKSTTWHLTGYKDEGGEYQPLISGTEISLIILTDGKISGSAGCNGYGGIYTVEENKISFQNIYSTEIYCAIPIGTMEQETWYLTSLRDSSSYQIQNGKLDIMNENGETILTYENRIQKI
ncbi:META domain-containing protein [Methanoplanus sp. FWC-SCC4]|uniref:META domain-containing protein n=1 Tax=Methanochimaera problematica TaxID=2609417 RepID=A0AA97FDT4_9EURY|nr:META domain-containing protein [Methanoplanus sp. FWC-SCC4]WOF16697.1 META domain-containing protein [Methanoplanus sp. FWC-SCC4]